MTPSGDLPGRRFCRHYTVAEATALLPDVARWLDELRLMRQEVARLGERLAELRHELGEQGGTRANQWTRSMVRLEAVFHEFRRRGILVEDLDRGLVGFPSIMAGREVLLSWEEGDEAITYWKEAGPGNLGRERMG